MICFCVCGFWWLLQVSPLTTKRNAIAFGQVSFEHPLVRKPFRSLFVFLLCFPPFSTRVNFFFGILETFSSSGCGKMPEIVKGVIQKAVCWIATLSSSVNAPGIHLAAAAAFCVGVVNNKLFLREVRGLWHRRRALSCFDVTSLSKYQVLTISAIVITNK